MFSKADVVNYYICRLKTSVRELFSQHVRFMPAADRVNLAVFKQSAVDFGKYQRALSSLEKPWNDLKVVFSLSNEKKSFHSGKGILTAPT